MENNIFIVFVHVFTYSQVPLQHGQIYHDIAYETRITLAESESDIRIATHILPGELWGFYCGDLGKNWPRYNGTALYVMSHNMTILYFHLLIFMSQILL